MSVEVLRHRRFNLKLFSSDTSGLIRTNPSKCMNSSMGILNRNEEGFLIRRKIFPPLLKIEHKGQAEVSA